MLHTVDRGASSALAETAIALSVRELTHAYGTKGVLKQLRLDVQAGEIFTLLGESGCGKTTLLRILAGLERPSGGEVAFKERPWASVEQRIFVPPQQRRIGFVFQSYAIWPHLTVFEHVAYPLRAARVARDDVAERVRLTLASVGLGGLEDRSAVQLSGGQQQRVAMARALVLEPELLLLDEPFSNLDVSLRAQLRLELREIQRRTALTIVLVTHDQLDAFTLSSRIAVMRDGRIEQVGTPETIYAAPATDFVRTFVGKSVRIGERWVRPEDLTVGHQVRSERDAWPGTVRAVVFLGDRYEYVIELDRGERVSVYHDRSERDPEGSRVFVGLRDVTPSQPL